MKYESTVKILENMINIQLQEYSNATVIGLVLIQAEKGAPG